MSIILKQSANGMVRPVDDARLYNLILSGQTGIVEGCEITYLSSNQLQISAGWGICQGRMFEIEQETIDATIAPSGTLKGRLLIHINVSAENPIQFNTQAAETLPELVQEDINDNGTIYEYELAVYDVNEIIISNLTQTFGKIEAPAEKPDKFTATLSASGWSNSAPYTQTLALPGIMSTDDPITDVILSDDVSAAIAQIEAYGCLSVIETADNSITAKCMEEKPSTDITVRFMVLR